MAGELSRLLVAIFDKRHQFVLVALDASSEWSQAVPKLTLVHSLDNLGEIVTQMSATSQHVDIQFD
jgi:hypothetical protein